MTSIPLEHLWGKADPSQEAGDHPALLHMLDVAAVAMELLGGKRLPESLSDPASLVCTNGGVLARYSMAGVLAKGVES